MDTRIQIGDVIRQEIPDDDLSRLKASIQANGVLQPIGVSVVGKDFELVFGHRRLLSARSLQLSAIPCVVLPEAATKADTLKLQLIENCCRTNPAPLDTARALQRMQ